MSASLDSDPAGAGILPNTYIVDTTSDADIAGCNAITANDCSLRGAITNANADPAADTISFSATVFPLATPATIIVGSTAMGPALPTLSAGLDTINATNRGVIIGGFGEPSTINCLTISGDGYTIEGLEVTDCFAGIVISASGDSNTIGPGNTVYDNTTGIEVAGNLNVITGNKIGTSVDGQTVNASGGNIANGITISGDTNTVGGNSVAARNIVSGNLTNGVAIVGGGTGNFVRGNYIGTDVDGNVDLGNSGFGVTVNEGTNTVGGSNAGEGNLISANNFGVGVALATTSGVIIRGNLIGTDSTGTADLGNSQAGISISDATGTTIGGTNAGERNVISGNNTVGIRLATTSGNTIQGNYIGTDITGAFDIGNTSNGIDLPSSASSNAIGGTVAGAGNVISGNNGTGINVFSGTSNQIQGNRIGTDATGTTDVGNSLSGININTASNTIGGSTVAHRNIISGNNSAGITISGAGATGNTVASNYIGVQADGASALGNTSHGVFVATSASTNTIGGATAAAANTIASNGGDGIYVFSGTGNSIRFNSMHSNTGLGIDIGGDGVTPNDAAPDADVGANNLQNFPVLTTVTSIGGQTDVQGTATGPASTFLTFDFYHNASCNTPGGNGEGQTHFASAVIATNASGNAAINQTFAVPVAAGRFVTATATATGGHTSEFSACREVPPLIVNDAADPGDGTCTVANCTLREALTAANAVVGLDIIEFAIASGPQTIAVVAPALPPISGPVTIDGTSQPGFTEAPIIEINGAAAGAGVTGLAVSGTGNVIRSLVINRFGASGISLTGGGSNTIQGNYIGTDLAGAADQGNLIEGIQLQSSADNLIGGDTPAARNVISGNGANGIRMFGSGSTGNVVSGNIIGLDVNGSVDIGNSTNGVLLNVNASANIIGGAASAERNIISGNNSDGVDISGAGATANTITGNYIGTDITGTLDRGQSSAGVRISGAPGTTVGGASAGLGNLISGNNNSGIEMTSTVSGVVQGNLIGTNLSGTSAVPNGDGVFISAASNLLVGGATAAARNVISGNSASGIQLDGDAGSVGANTIKGNYIGVGPDGVTALGNGDGIFVNNASSTLIGGSTDSAANTIAFNDTFGVSINSGTGNDIGRNSIHSNGGLGIDLDIDGITPNDAGDGDAGPNNLQNFPVLASAGFGASSTHLNGALNSAASTVFTLTFFHNAACDPSGNGEGQVFLGSANAATDAGGNAMFGTVLGVGAPAGSFVTATATDPAGNTSEFSACIQVLDDDDDDNDGYADDAEAGTPLCSGNVNDDGAPMNDDSLVNDGCPAVGPAEGVCNDAIDNDVDGRINDGCVQSGALSEAQFNISTGHQDPCGGNGWPAETFTAAPSANKLTIQDLAAFIAPDRRIDTSPGHPKFQSRMDLLPGKGPFSQWINILDLTALFTGPTAFPPMFGGARAFDKTCPWAP